MSHQLFKLPRQLNYNGNLTTVPGAKAYFYLSGTSTPQTVYQDADLTIPHANPVVADFLGLLPAIYMNPGVRHKLTLKTSADVDLYTTDPINDQIPPTYTRTAAEIAAGVTPVDFSGSSRPWTDAVMRYGLSGDDETDNLTAFTQMFSVGGQALFIKRGTYLITSSINVPSNTIVYIEPGTIFRDGGILPDQAFIRCDDVSNVHIIAYGAKILMDRADYVTGEQRHGLRIRGDCQNITVEGLECSDCGGDGFFIGALTGSGSVPEYINLVRCKADNNRRQGLSITTGRHIRIVDCSFTNTNGTSPQAGIDIEPNESAGVLEDIKLVNVYTGGNAQQGIKIYLSPLDNTSDPVSIDIENHLDVGSAYGLTVHEARGGCRGNIRVHNPIWKENSQFGFAAVSCAPDNILIELFNPTVIDCNQNGSSAELAGSAYAIYRDSGHSATGQIGGVHIYNPDVQVTLAETPSVTFYVVNSDEPGEVNDVWIIDPKNVEYTAAGATSFGTSPVYITDRHGVMGITFTASTTISASRYFSRYNNSGAAGTLNWDLADWPETESERTFEVHTAQVLNIRADQVNAALRIFPGSYTALRCNEIGGKITLKRAAGGFWVTNMAGVWHNNTLFSIANESLDRTYDVSTVTLTELANVVAALLTDTRRGS